MPTCTCDKGWSGTECLTCAYFVDLGAKGTGDGSSWANAFTTITPALAAAESNVAAGASTCDVWVKAGTYYVYSSGKDDTISIPTNVGLYGGFAGTETQRSQADPTANKTTLSGTASASGSPSVRHVVRVNVQGAVIDGFTIRDGNADGTTGYYEDGIGGGVLLYGNDDHNAFVTVSRCEITANAASNVGGGIGVVFGTTTITVTDCNVHDNTAASAGGMMFFGGNTCTMTGTTFKSNTATNGNGGVAGGVRIHSANNLVLSNDTFLDNVASNDAGALMVESNPATATATYANLYFSGNRSGGIGGAVALGPGNPVTFTNTVMLGNQAGGLGGAIDDQIGATFVNCTITGNKGGDAALSGQSTTTLVNSIVWGNPSRVAVSTNQDVSSNIVNITYSDVGGHGGSNMNLDVDPVFATVPAFFDWTTMASSGGGSIAVPSGTFYQVNDLIEIGEDGAQRLVTGISGNTVSFFPVLSSPAAAGVQVRDWRSTTGSLDLHLATGSMCLDAGAASVAPMTDITGKKRGNPPDLGAYESP